MRARGPSITIKYIKSFTVKCLDGMMTKNDQPLCNGCSSNFRPPTLNSDVNLIMTVHVLVSLVRIASQGHRKHANKSQIS